MTTATAPQSPARPSGPIMPGVLRAEWAKLASVRSTPLLLLTALVVTVAISAVVTTVYAAQYDPAFAARHTVDPTYWSLDGVIFGQFAIGVLGVLAIGSEYDTGLISTTFTAVPQRRTVFLAKIVVTSTTALATGLASGLGAFLLGQAILSREHVQTTLGDPGVPRAVLGSGLYLAVLAVLAVSLAALIRHSTGAIVALLGLLLVLPALGAVLPASWQHTLAPYLPGNAGLAILHVVPMPNTAAPWTGFTVFCAYTALAFAAALLVLSRRDTLPR